MKWKLMLTTLPYVAAVLAVKLALQQLFAFPGLLDFTEMGLVLTASAFLMGFMLSGVMSDFKESEKLPGEIACTLETIEDHFRQAHAIKAGVNLLDLQRTVRTLVGDIESWMFRRTPRESIYPALEALLGPVQQLERLGAGPVASKVLGEIHNLRKAVTRVGVISRTGFLSPAYALLETLLAIIVVLLMASRYKSMLAMMILVPFITLIYVYMLRLIRDIDDPFDYSPDGSKQGGAEVELFPLAEYRERLAARVAAKA